MLFKACDLHFYFHQKRLTLVLDVTQYSPIFCLIAIGPKKKKQKNPKKLLNVCTYITYFEKMHLEWFIQTTVC